MWQCCTGLSPYMHHTSLFTLETAVVAGERPPLTHPAFSETPAETQRTQQDSSPSDTPTRLRELVAQCWHAQADQRPSIQVVLGELMNMHEAVTGAWIVRALSLSLSLSLCLRLSVSVSVSVSLSLSPSLYTVVDTNRLG